MGEHGLRHEEGAADVEVVDLGEVGGGKGGERLGEGAAGVVDEDVNACFWEEGGECDLDDVLGGFYLAEVGADFDC